MEPVLENKMGTAETHTPNCWIFAGYQLRHEVKLHHARILTNLQTVMSTPHALLQLPNVQARHQAESQFARHVAPSRQLNVSSAPTGVGFSTSRCRSGWLFITTVPVGTIHRSCLYQLRPIILGQPKT
ncbi:hypothetical protein TNCV_2928581 [Trichonephila clavipes]|nr:hypothetical protein TNCV_2928581 [Trichonephila clavipes]